MLAQKSAHPCWGAKKIHALLWPPTTSHAPVCVRTVDRILSRAGLVTLRRSPTRKEELACRFERARSNELWQLDYKGLPAKAGYSALSVIDDHSRFCLALSALPDRTVSSLWSVLWQVMGEFGLPERLLCDNGDSFNAVASPGPTRFQASCWLLGISTSHGRPGHPQTQGKVERLHATMERELAESLVQPSSELAQESYDSWRRIYNWERPHEAIGQKVPGAVYESARPSRPRPDKMPAHEPAAGAITRKADAAGRISDKGVCYLVGKGLAGEHVEVVQNQTNGELLAR